MERITGRQTLSFLARCTYKFFHDGSLNAYGIMIGVKVKELTTLYCLIGWAFALQVSAGYTISPLASFFGGRAYWPIVAVFGGFLVAFGYFCQSVPDDVPLWLLMLFIIISGLGFGVLNIVTIMSLKDSFPDTYGMWYSISSMAADLGVASLPRAYERLIDFYGGEFGSLVFGLTTGILILLGCMMPWPDMDRGGASATPRTNSCASDGECSEDSVGESSEDTDGECSEHPDADGECSEDSDVGEESPFVGIPEHDLEGTHDMTHHSNDCHASNDGLMECYSSMFRNHPLVYYHVIIDGIVGYAATGWSIFLVPYGVSAGLDLSTAVWLSTLAGLAGFTARGLCAVLYYNNCMSVRLGFVAPSSLVIVGYTLSLSLENFYTFSVMAVLTGFGLSAGKCVVSAVVPSLVCDFHFRYLVITQYTVGAVLDQAGGFFTGALIDLTGSYRLSFGFLAVLSFIQLITGVAWSRSKYLAVQPDRVK